MRKIAYTREVRSGQVRRSERDKERGNFGEDCCRMIWMDGCVFVKGG